MSIRPPDRPDAVAAPKVLDGAVAVLAAQALNRALLARQLLLDRTELPVSDALEHLVGLQGQAPDAPYVALWSRLRDFEPGALAELLPERSAVRMPLMRCTLHLVTRGDALAIRPALQPVLERAFASSPWARNLAGIELEELLALAGVQLAEPLTRADLGRRLGERWPDMDPLSLAYAVTTLVPAVQVPPRGIWGERAQATWVGLDPWLSGAREPPASPESLVLRYLGAFGPASALDFGKWSGLTGTRALFAQLRPQLRTFSDENGRELFDLEDGQLPDPETPAPPRFLGEYDNILLSHADRTRVIEGVRKPPIPPGNGAREGTVLIDGFMRARWKLGTLDEETTELRVTPSTPLPDDDATAVAAEANRLLAFLLSDGHRGNVIVDAS